MDLMEWAVGLMERDNRKSHLAPQLSPSTQDLLRSSDSDPYSSQHESQSSQTPTFGEITISGAGVISPRDQQQALKSARSPSRNGNAISRTPGLASQRPSMGQRTGTSESIPRSAGYESSGSAQFSLPVRPAPPSGPLPPPPRRQTPDRRQPQYGAPPSSNHDDSIYRRQ